MTVLHVLEVEALVGLGVFGISYGAISFVLWRLSRDSERRRREQGAGDPPRPATGR